MFFGFYVFHMFCIFIITIEPNRIQTRLATQNDRLNLLKDIHLVDTKKRPEVVLKWQFSIRKFWGFPSI